VERENPIKGIWRWVRVNRQRWREREGMREKRETWCERVSAMEREREIRDRGKRKPYIYT